MISTNPSYYENLSSGLPLPSDISNSHKSHHNSSNNGSIGSNLTAGSVTVSASTRASLALSSSSYSSFSSSPSRTSASSSSSQHSFSNSTNSANYSSPKNHSANLAPARPPFSRTKSSSSFSSTTSSASSINSSSTPLNQSYLQVPSTTGPPLSSSNSNSMWSTGTYVSSSSLPAPPGLTNFGNSTSVNTNNNINNNSSNSNNNNDNAYTRSRPTPINIAKANENVTASAPSPRAAIVAGLRSATDRRHQQRAAVQQQQQVAQLQVQQSMGFFGDYPQPPFSQGTSQPKRNSLNSPTLASFQTLSNMTTPVASGFVGANIGGLMAPNPNYGNFGLVSPSPIVDPNNMLANLSMSPPSSPIPMERYQHQQYQNQYQHQPQNSQDKIDVHYLAALQQKQQELLATSRLIAQQQQQIQAAMAQAAAYQGVGSGDFSFLTENGANSNSNSINNSPVQGYAGLSNSASSISRRGSPIPSLHQLSQTIHRQRSNSNLSNDGNNKNNISSISDSYLYDNGSPLLPPSLPNTFMYYDQNQQNQQWNSNPVTHGQMGESDGFGGLSMMSPPQAPFYHRSSTPSGTGKSRPSSPGLPSRPSSSASIRNIRSNNSSISSNGSFNEVLAGSKSYGDKANRRGSSSTNSNGAGSSFRKSYQQVTSTSDNNNSTPASIKKSHRQSRLIVGKIKHSRFEVPERQPYGGPAVEELEATPSLNFAAFAQ